MKCVLSFRSAALFSLFAATAHAAEMTCPERLDRQERFTLTLSKQIDILKDTIILLEAQKKTYGENEGVYQKRIALTETLVGTYKGMWQDAEKRATRGWYETPMLWIGVGVFATVLLVVGIGFTVKAIYDGRTQWQGLLQ